MGYVSRKGWAPLVVGLLMATSGVVNAVDSTSGPGEQAVGDKAAVIQNHGHDIQTGGGDLITSSGEVDTGGGAIRTSTGPVETGGGDLTTGSGTLDTQGGDIGTAGGGIDTFGGNLRMDGGTIRTEGGSIYMGGAPIQTESGDVDLGGSGFIHNGYLVQNSCYWTSSQPQVTCNAGHYAAGYDVTGPSSQISVYCCRP